MHRLAILIIAVLTTIPALPANAASWPQDKHAAIVLTYDDGLASQLDIAIPQLDRAGFKGTFFLNQVSTDTVGRWRAAAETGHELGNHTVTHPCPLAILPGRTNPTDDYEVSWILGEIGMMNGQLNALNGDRPRTMAYPCSQTYVRDTNYKEALRASHLIRYARTGGNKDTAVISPANPLDPLEIPSFDPVPGSDPSGVPTGAELIAFVKQVQQAGGVGVFQFHGVGGDYLSVPAAAHQELIHYLRSQPDVWVATFQEVMDARSTRDTDAARTHP